MDHFEVLIHPFTLGTVRDRYMFLTNVNVNHSCHQFLGEYIGWDRPIKALLITTTYPSWKCQHNLNDLQPNRRSLFSHTYYLRCLLTLTHPWTTEVCDKYVPLMLTWSQQLYSQKQTRQRARRHVHFVVLFSSFSVQVNFNLWHCHIHKTYLQLL